MKKGNGGLLRLLQRKDEESVDQFIFCPLIIYTYICSTLACYILRTYTRLLCVMLRVRHSSISMGSILYVVCAVYIGRFRDYSLSIFPSTWDWQ